MGGGSSRFEATDWEKVDGKLTSREQTVDNACPTTAYGVYYLTKRGVNQRDYDVTDIESNLLYCTRAVEGTLTWFDVLGKGIDEYLLRVQVDLSRRYWVVYRYDVPAFAGQVSTKACTGRLETSLFRKACITVTWARYHAVVDPYEPPAREKDEEEDTTDSLVEEKKTDDVAAEESATIDGQVDGTAYTESMGLGNDIAQSAGVVNETTTDKDPLGSVVPENAHATAQSSPDEPSSLPIGSSSNVRGTDNPKITKQSSSLRASIDWVKTRAAATMETVGAPYLPTDRNEGVITLDNPLLKVQEINSLSGQHQTMLIRREEVQKLKDEELLIEAKLAGEVFHCTNDEPLATHGNEDGDSALLIGTNMDDATKVSDDSIAAASVMRNDEESDDSSDTFLSAEDRKEKSEEPATSDASASNVDSDENQGSALNRDSGTNENIDNDEQPLLGFWSWDSRIRVHRMRMHLGAGADLALHIVLAVVTNQLRYERHAMAVAV